MTTHASFHAALLVTACDHHVWVTIYDDVISRWVAGVSCPLKLSDLVLEMSALGFWEEISFSEANAVLDPYLVIKIVNNFVNDPDVYVPLEYP